MKKIGDMLCSKIVPNWAFLIIIVVIIVFMLFGWKIVYAPQMANDWIAIDAIGGWVSIIISGIAIWFAVASPKRIAKEQNKIALFEKRFSCYVVFLKYTTFANSISANSDRNCIRKALMIAFEKDSPIFDSTDFAFAIKKDEKVLMSSLFLFSDFCWSETIQNMLDSMLPIIKQISKNESTLSNEERKEIDVFCKKCEEIEKSCMSEMRNQMLINE